MIKNAKISQKVLVIHNEWLYRDKGNLLLLVKYIS